MVRPVREYVEIAEYASLDSLIEALLTLRDTLPPESDAELRMRGDDIFGRRFCISYLRPQTDEEAACDIRCEEAYQQWRRRHLEEQGATPLPLSKVA